MSNFSPMPLSNSQCWWKRARCRGWWCPLSRNLKSRQFAAFTDSHSWLHFTFCVHCSDRTMQQQPPLTEFLQRDTVGEVFLGQLAVRQQPLAALCWAQRVESRWKQGKQFRLDSHTACPRTVRLNNIALREAAVLWALPDEFGPVAEHHEQHSQHRDDIDELPHVGVQTEWSFLPNHRDWPTSLSVCLSVFLQPGGYWVYVETVLTQNRLFWSEQQRDWLICPASPCLPCAQCAQQQREGGATHSKI